MTAKKPRAPPHEKEEHDQPETTTTKVIVTYLPGDGDNDATTVNGIHFKADEPTELDPSKAREANVIARISNNPFFHVGDNPPMSGKSAALAERTEKFLEELEAAVDHFRSGSATHEHADQLVAIARKIKESAR